MEPVAGKFFLHDFLNNFWLVLHYILTLSHFGIRLLTGVNSLSHCPKWGRRALTTSVTSQAATIARHLWWQLHRTVATPLLYWVPLVAYLIKNGIALGKGEKTDRGIDKNMGRYMYLLQKLQEFKEHMLPISQKHHFQDYQIYCLSTNLHSQVTKSSERGARLRFKGFSTWQVRTNALLLVRKPSKPTQAITHRYSRTQGRTCWVSDITAFSLIFHQDIWPPR